MERIININKKKIDHSINIEKKNRISTLHDDTTKQVTSLWELLDLSLNYTSKEKQLLSDENADIIELLVSTDIFATCPITYEQLSLSYMILLLYTHKAPDISPLCQLLMRLSFALQFRGEPLIFEFAANEIKKYLHLSIENGFGGKLLDNMREELGITQCINLMKALIYYLCLNSSKFHHGDIFKETPNISTIVEDLITSSQRIVVKHQSHSLGDGSNLPIRFSTSRDVIKVLFSNPLQTDILDRILCTLLTTSDEDFLKNIDNCFIRYINMVLWSPKDYEKYITRQVECCRNVDNKFKTYFKKLLQEQPHILTNSQINYQNMLFKDLLILRSSLNSFLNSRKIT